MNTQQITPKPRQIKIKKTHIQSRILSKHQVCIRNFTDFVSMMPDLEKAILLIYPGKFCDPTKFFDLFPRDPYFEKAFDMYMSTVQIPQPTLLIGLNYDYLNLPQKNTQFTQKHLILLYLLKKLKNIKFALCFDDQAVQQSNFQTIKLTFRLFSSILKLQNAPQYSQSFIALFSHAKQDVKQIMQIYKSNLLASLKQGITFYNQINEFVNQILKPILDKDLTLPLQYKLKENQYEDKKNSFFKLIKGRRIFNTRTDFGEPSKINQHFLTLLIERSRSQLINVHAVNGQTPNPQQNMLRDLFSNWDSFFKSFIDYAIKTIKKGKHSQHFKKIKQEQIYIPIKSTKKYVIKQNQSKQLLSFANQSIRILKFITFLQQYYIDTLESYRLLKSKNANPNISQTKFQKLRKQFYNSFYEFGILNGSSQEQKILFDFLMIFQQLNDVWSNLQLYDKDVKCKSTLFIPSKMTKNLIIQRQQVKNRLVSQVQNICILRLQSDFNKYMIQKNLPLKQISQTLLQLKSCIDKVQSAINKLIQEDKSQRKQSNKTAIQILRSVLFQSQRFTKITRKFQLQFKKNKINDLSNRPIQKIKYLIEQIQQSQKDFQQKKSLVQALGQTIVQIINQHKLPDYKYKLHLLALNILSFSPLNNISIIQQLYLKIYHKIQSKYRNTNKTQKSVQNYEKDILIHYIQHLLSQGLIQKARQISYQISLIDQQLCKKLLIKCIQLKENTKLHINYTKRCLQLNLKKAQQKLFLDQVYIFTTDLKNLIIRSGSTQVFDTKVQVQRQLIQEMDI